MFILLALVLVALGVRFTTTHPEVVYQLGPVGVTYYHLLFLAAAFCIVRGVWKWVND